MRGPCDGTSIEPRVAMTRARACPLRRARRRGTSTVVAAALVLTGAIGTAEAADVSLVLGVPGAAADVYVNDARLFAGLQPGVTTKEIGLPAGRYTFALRPAGAPAGSPAERSTTVRLPATGSASIVDGLGADGRPTLRAYANAPLRARAGRALVVFRPVAGAKALDLRLDGSPVFRAVAAGAETHRAVPAGRHALSVADPATPESGSGGHQVRLAPGRVYVVYGVGSPQAQTLEQIVQEFAGGRALVRRAPPLGALWGSFPLAPKGEAESVTTPTETGASTAPTGTTEAPPAAPAPTTSGVARSASRTPAPSGRSSSSGVDWGTVAVLAADAILIVAGLVLIGRRARRTTLWRW